MQTTSSRWQAVGLQRLSSTGVSALLIAGIGVIYFWLLFVYLGPLDTFWSSDHAVKLYQVQSLLQQDFREHALIYPGAQIDPEQRYSPFRGQYLWRDGAVYGMFSQPFAAISALPYALFGYPGLYLVPLFSALGCLWIFAQIGQRFLRPASIYGGIVILGIASPFSFYAVNFWEHTPATLLVLLTFWWMLRAIEQGQLGWSGGAGVALALAIYFRNEAALFAPALAVGMLITRQPQVIRHGIALGSGMALGLVPLLWFHHSVYGTLLGPHVAVAGAGGRLNAQRWIDLLIVPVTPWLIPFTLVLLLGLFVIQQFWAPLRTYGRWIMLGLALALTVQLSAALEQIPLSSLLMTFPLVLLAFTPPPTDSAHADPRQSQITMLLLSAISFMALALLIRLPDGGSQHGPRMFLPVLPLLLLVGLWNVERWLRAPRLPIMQIGMIVTLTVMIHAALVAQSDGWWMYRYVLSENNKILVAAGQSGQQVIITDTVYTPILLGPLMYSEQTIFMVITGEELDGLIAQLAANGIDQFYYLGTRPPVITDTSAQWPALVPLSEATPLAHRLVGQAFQVAP